MVQVLEDIDDDLRFIARLKELWCVEAQMSGAKMVAQLVGDERNMTGLFFQKYWEVHDPN